MRLAIENKTRLRWLLAALFLALAVPTAALILQAFDQLRLDAVRRYEADARAYVRNVDAGLRRAIADQDAIARAEFEFWVDSVGAERARSPLSAFPVMSSLGGVVAYFQVAGDGMLSSPLWPAGDVDIRALDMGEAERDARLALLGRVASVLADNRLAVRRLVPEAQAAASANVLDEIVVTGALRARAPEDAVAEDGSEPGDSPSSAVGPAVFDELSASAVASAGGGQAETTALFSEQAESLVEEPSPGPVNTFAETVEPFRFNRLASGQFVIHRNVFDSGMRLVQGALIDDSRFVDTAFGEAFGAERMSSGGRLLVSFADRPVAEIRGSGVFAYDGTAWPADRGATIRERLSPPFADFSLEFAAGELPGGPAYSLMVWLSAIVVAVLCGGFLLIYRVLAGQIELARRQEEFVSSVSHELKTPLTSIRMYGEMLMSGWADEAKRQSYYRYILDEGERLTRLIDNVLRIAGSSRAEAPLEIEAMPAGELLDLVRARSAKQAEAAGYALDFEVADGVPEAMLEVDKDAFVQIMINLVDNAIKYSAGAAQARVSIRAEIADGACVVRVRDFGPGITGVKPARLFEPFYRSGDERTRSVQGTGIGLSVVRDLTRRMGGEVGVRNCEPGAEFSIRLPLRD